MKATKHELQVLTRIHAHGEKLLRIFPNAIPRDPVKLCAALRRIEVRANKLMEDDCSRPMANGEYSVRLGKITSHLSAVLGPHDVPVFVNTDPRGYALKIHDAWIREHRPALPTDAGGYGLLAPDLSQP